MSIPTIEGISAETISNARITTRVLFSGPEDGIPVLFLHGNLSSATWWEETMVALPDGYRGIAPDQRGYGDADPAQLTDATRGLGDLADDAYALLDHLGIETAHIVGSSMGGSVVWFMLVSAPERIRSAKLVDPGSPYGFGATKGPDGEPCNPDFTGSGGGLINPQVVQLIRDGYRGADNPFGLRTALRNLVYQPGNVPAREEELLSSSLSTHLGERSYPGDKTMSAHWPFVAPGVWGVNNGLSPKYAIDIAAFTAVDPKPPILWLRGANDLTVADGAAADMAVLGGMGLIPGYPGADVYPPQPMLAQTRAVLEKYAAAGGTYNEVVIENTAHAPYIDDLEAFNAVFHPFIK